MYNFKIQITNFRFNVYYNNKSIIKALSIPRNYNKLKTNFTTNKHTMNNNNNQQSSNDTFNNEIRTHVAKEAISYGFECLAEAGEAAEAAEGGASLVEGIANIASFFG